MTPNQFVNSIAALLAWREENANGLNGMLGVLFCLRNRVKAGWFQSDLFENIIAHNQFSSMTVTGDGQLTHYPSMHDQNFQKLLQYVDSVYDPENPLQDTLTQGGLYYSDLSSPGFTKGGWFDTGKLSRNRTNIQELQ